MSGSHSQGQISSPRNHERGSSRGSRGSKRSDKNRGHKSSSRDARHSQRGTPRNSHNSFWEQNLTPYTLTSVNLSSLLQDQNSLAEAEPIFRQALAGLEEELGPSHQFTLVSIDNLATLLLGAGRLQEAKELYERAIREAEVVLSPTDPQTLTSVNNLAALLQEQKKFKEAEQLFRRALDGREEALGPLHPQTLTSVNNLASILQELGEYKEAETFYWRALRGSEEALGKFHPQTITAVSNLANLLADQGRCVEAELPLRWTVEGKEKTAQGGRKDPVTLTALNNLASLLRQQGRLQESEEIYSEVLSNSQDVLGHHHPFALLAAENLASLLQDQGRLREAEPLKKRVFNALEQSLESILECHSDAQPSLAEGKAEGSLLLDVILDEHLVLIMCFSSIRDVLAFAITTARLRGLLMDRVRDIAHGHFGSQLPRALCNKKTLVQLRILQAAGDSHDPTSKTQDDMTSSNGRSSSEAFTCGSSSGASHIFLGGRPQLRQVWETEMSRLRRQRQADGRPSSSRDYGVPRDSPLQM